MRHRSTTIRRPPLVRLRGGESPPLQQGRRAATTAPPSPDFCRPRLAGPLCSGPGCPPASQPSGVFVSPMTSQASWLTRETAPPGTCFHMPLWAPMNRSPWTSARLWMCPGAEPTEADSPAASLPTALEQPPRASAIATAAVIMPAGLMLTPRAPITGRGASASWRSPPSAQRPLPRRVPSRPRSTLSPGPDWPLRWRPRDA